jgi:hypothetical protein
VPITRFAVFRRPDAEGDAATTPAEGDRDANAIGAGRLARALVAARRT